MLENTESQYVFKILILGDSRVGKTSIMVRYVDNIFNEQYTKTIGVRFMSKRVYSNKNSVKLSIWDVAGQMRYPSFAKTYCRACNFIVFVYDITNQQSFASLRWWIDAYAKMLPDIKFAVIGNKNDLEVYRKVEAVEMTDLLPRYADRNLFLTETSAKTGENVDEAFDIIITYLVDSC
jgi:small GTP-binding protein